MYLKFTCRLQRYVFAIVGFVVTLVSYMMRISLDVTISSMVNQSKISTTPHKYDAVSCSVLTITLPNRTVNVGNGVVHVTTFDWESQTQQSALSAFGSAVFITPLIGGTVAEKYGGKIIMGFSLLTQSICTIIIPFACKLLGPTALNVLRFLTGLATGMINPVLFAVMSKWAPKDEQAFICSIIFSGSLIGCGAGSWFGDVIVDAIGWEAVFYIFGSLGAICYVLWRILIYITPNRHPYISKNEKKYLNENLISLKRTTEHDLDPFPWKAVLRCAPFWSIVIGYAGREWAFKIFTSQVPQFMEDVMFLDVLRHGVRFSPFFTYMPYVVMWLSALLCSSLCYIIVKKDICCVKNARRFFTAISTIGAVICIIIIMYSGCNHVLTIFSMFMGMAVLGAFYSGCMISVLDIAPNYAGSVAGVLEIVSVTTLVLLNMIKDHIVTEALLRQWQLTWWIVIMFLTTCIVLYVYYIQADQMWWDDVRKNGYPENWSRGFMTCEGIINEHGESLYNLNDEKEDTRITAL